ncbi:MAG: hypothetical protein M3Z04_25445 [Chloroflexota bacterium]|nr:hypothetical protein [Chloroflexota bacterium]
MFKSHTQPPLPAWLDSAWRVIGQPIVQRIPEALSSGAQLAFYLTLTAALIQLLPHTTDWVSVLLNFWLEMSLLTGVLFVILRMAAVRAAEPPVPARVVYVVMPAGWTPPEGFDPTPAGWTPTDGSDPTPTDWTPVEPPNYPTAASHRGDPPTDTTL